MAGCGLSFVWRRPLFEQLDRPVAFSFIPREPDDPPTFTPELVESFYPSLAIAIGHAELRVLKPTRNGAR